MENTRPPEAGAASLWRAPTHSKVALGDLIANENPLVLENLPPQ